MITYLESQSSLTIAVIPAKAGIQVSLFLKDKWIPDYYLGNDERGILGVPNVAARLNLPPFPLHFQPGSFIIRLMLKKGAVREWGL